MKKVLALVLCLIMVVSVASIVISADDTVKLIDARELEAYGQQHFYLGAPVAGADIPDVMDAVVEEDEYVFSYEYKEGDFCAEWTDKGAGATFHDNEWVKVYLSYDEENLYIAQVTKDPDYRAGKDGFAFNLCMRDGFMPADSVSRLCFDLYEKVGAEDINSVKSGCRHMVKLPDGTWNNPPATDGMEYINGISVNYDEETELLTMEVAFDIKSQQEFWGNEHTLEDLRVYFVPFVYMYGETVEGAGDEVMQGVIWSYLRSSVDPMIKLQFTMDYPEFNGYWPSFFPNIIHFTEKPAETTPPPTEPTTAPVVDETTAPVVDETTAPVVDETTAPVVDETTAPVVGETTAKPAATTAKPAATTAAEEEGGCGSAIALSALAIVPMLGAAIVLGKKKEN